MKKLLVLTSVLAIAACGGGGGGSGSGHRGATPVTTLNGSIGSGFLSSILLP